MKYCWNGKAVSGIGYKATDRKDFGLPMLLRNEDLRSLLLRTKSWATFGLSAAGISHGTVVLVAWLAAVQSVADLNDV